MSSAAALAPSNTQTIKLIISTSGSPALVIIKDAWFWAVEDWWIDDVGGIVSSGTTSSFANTRRETLTKHLLRRATHEVHTYFSFAYHNDQLKKHVNRIYRHE